MKNIRSLMCVAVCLCATATLAQPVKLEKSTVCNADGTVTFRYENPNAKDVQVDVQFAGRNPMQKDANGIWTATLGPAAPDMYPYCFVVDGVSVMDPLCPQYFPTRALRTASWRFLPKVVALRTTSRTCLMERWSISTTIPTA